MRAARRRFLRAFAPVAVGLLAACQSVPGLDTRPPLTVAETPTRATAADGRFIAWREHPVDDEATNGGLPIRGGDGLVEGDIDRDGYLDIVSVHEDSNHLRIAFGSADPDVWTLVTVAAGDIVGAIEDVALRARPTGFPRWAGFANRPRSTSRGLIIASAISCPT